MIVSLLAPVERIGRVVDLVVAQGGEQAVGHELDVLGHLAAVHADEVARQSLAGELLLRFSARPTHDARCFSIGFYLIGKVNDST